MEGEIADQVHTQGFEGDGRIFRLFTFSKLLGRYELSKDKKFIRFPEGANWIVSSPLNDILGSIAGGLLKQQTLRIGGASADITGIQISHPNVQSETIRVRTLSPVVAYSTLFRGDGSKYTVYLQPGEPEFRRIVAENLQKKWEGIKTWNQAEKKDENESSYPMNNALTIRQRSKERTSPRLRIYGNRYFLEELTEVLSSQVEISPKRVQKTTKHSEFSGILYYQSRREKK